MLAWRNWQTRTAQDRMGKPVEVRVLSRAVKRILRADYLDPAFLLAAQRAFISWESFLRPAGVSWPFFLAGVAARAPLSLAQRAFAAAASFARVVGEK